MAKKINRLFLNRGYLCGAMDRVVDGGLGWRKQIQSDLSDLHVCWLDPTNKPIDIGIEDMENRTQRHQWKRTHNYEAVRNDMKIIRGVDLRMVDIADFLIANLDTDVHACGSYEEIYLANREMKPIIIHIEQGKEHAPDWLYGVIPHEFIFSTWPEVYDYMRHVAHDPVVEQFKRWYFFDFSYSFRKGAKKVAKRIVNRGRK
jgi:hypothetical protein